MFLVCLRITGAKQPNLAAPTIFQLHRLDRGEEFILPRFRISDFSEGATCASCILVRLKIVYRWGSKPEEIFASFARCATQWQPALRVVAPRANLAGRALPFNPLAMRRASSLTQEVM